MGGGSFKNSMAPFSPKEREKKISAPLNTVVSKHILQYYLHLYKWAAYVNMVPLQMLPWDHNSESVHSAAQEKL